MPAGQVEGRRTTVETAASPSPHRPVDPQGPSPRLSGWAGLVRFPFDGFERLSLSFQSAFHLSLTVLVRYRTPNEYLALDGVHHPLRAAFPSNPTLRSRDSPTIEERCYGAPTLSGAPFQETLHPLDDQERDPRSYTSWRERRPPRFSLS